MSEEQKKTIHEKILKTINDGRLIMRPKRYFIVRSALFALGTIMVFLVGIFIASFIIFTLHQNGTWFVPAFGTRGIRSFLFSLPWILIIVTVLFMILLEILVKKYSFAYRQPLLLSAFSVLAIVLIGSAVIAETPIHPSFFKSAREGHLPFAGQFYRGFGMMRSHDIHPGTITQIIVDGFKMNDRDNDDIITVFITPETEFPFGTNFTVNDKVVVLGELASSAASNTIRAIGIRTIGNPPIMGTSTLRRPHHFHFLPAQ
jgi:hypothetical protein